MYWATSDWHLGHHNIIKHERRDRFLSLQDWEELEKCGGSWDHGDWSQGSNYKVSEQALERMTEHFIAITNKYVWMSDTLFIVGDWCLGDASLSKHCLSQLNCLDIHLIRGNHDKINVKKSGFLSVQDSLDVKWSDRDFVLSHYPCVAWDKSHRGSIHLHGHTHGNLDAWKQKHMPGSRSKDVGIDCSLSDFGQYQPYSFEWLVQNVGSKSGHFPIGPGYFVDGPTAEVDL